MYLKQCPCCKKELTTSDIRFDGITKFGNSDIAWFTCNDCGSTPVLRGASLTSEKRAALLLLPVYKHENSQARSA